LPQYKNKSYVTEQLESLTIMHSLMSVKVNRLGIKFNILRTNDLSNFKGQDYCENKYRM